MKRLLSFALILLAAGSAGAAPSSVTRADYLANKKTNIEARGNQYDSKQWSDHFDRMDVNRDGILTAGGLPMEVPVHSIQETGKRPTAMLDRNLAYLSLVESLVLEAF